MLKTKYYYNGENDNYLWSKLTKEVSSITCPNWDSTLKTKLIDSQTNTVINGIFQQMTTSQQASFSFNFGFCDVDSESLENIGNVQLNILLFALSLELCDLMNISFKRNHQTNCGQKSLFHHLEVVN